MSIIIHKYNKFANGKNIMKEKYLFGKLLPANPDIQLILKFIREKFDLPEIELGDDL